MAPSAIAIEESSPKAPELPTLPENARRRLEKAGIDISKGYPYKPTEVWHLDDVYKMRAEFRPYVDRGSLADPSKKALLSAAKEVNHLTAHIGTEIVGLQLKDLTDQQKDELALLIAERSVVFFRDQDLSPQQQLELGRYYGEIEVNPQDAYIPGLPGTTVVWPDLTQLSMPFNFRFPFGTQRWHSDMVYEAQPPGITHLHQDTVPAYGGDTLWASGYSAYEKLSPMMRSIIDGKECVYVSAYRYIDKNEPHKGPQVVERTHPMVRVHPATGWKSLYVNRTMTKRIVGLEPGESDAILNYLFHVYESNVDIQCRFKWTPGTSALWDNRITMHSASWDYEGGAPRHGVRVISLAEKPYFDANATTRRAALGLVGPLE